MIPLIVIFVIMITCSNSSVDTENPDIPVIIGGKNGSDPYVEVEVYNPKYETCSDNTEPRIPDFPVPIYGASAVYVKDIGIYVCGGGKPDCYTYNPRQNKR